MCRQGKFSAAVTTNFADECSSPLPPAGCHSAELQFLPLQPGLLCLDAIRIVDLASGAFIDLRDLPDIVAVERRQS